MNHNILQKKEALVTLDEGPWLEKERSFVLYFMIIVHI